jgi:Icc protein
VKSPVIIAQISDLHIGAAPKLRDEWPEDNLLRAFEALRPINPDIILATGDLANDEGAGEYEALAQLLPHAPAPVYLLPGNHDAPAKMRIAFPEHSYFPADGHLSYAIEHLPVRVVCLDQTEPHAVHGRFTKELAAWLNATLASAPDKPTLVALHHPPFPTNDILFDTIGLLEPENFRRVIARHPQVKRIVCGHHHRLTTSVIAHAPAISAPSTAWTYGSAFQDGDTPATITTEPPAFLLHVWTERGGFATHMVNF